MAKKEMQKPHKSPTKLLNKPVMKASKKPKNKKNFESFAIYLHRLLKSISGDSFGISRKAMMIMDNFTNDLMEKLAIESHQLNKKTKSKTLTSRDIAAAVKLSAPGELAKHANMEGSKAVTTYAKTTLIK